LAVLSCFALPAAEAAPPAPANRLDHILLWGKQLDQSTADLAVKLGFQVRPGRDPNGVANRYVRFGDGTYIELLGFTRPNPELDPGEAADQASLKGQPGARSFGIRSFALDRDQALLKAKGLPVTPVFAASPNDPDGLGPGQPPRWRLFAFEAPPLSSSLFYIDYAPQAAHADDAIVRQHPNGARALSAVWMLSADAAANRTALARLGYADALPVRLPQVGARGFCVAVGPTALLLLEPDGAGAAQAALSRGGAQILGVSVAVEDLARTRRLVERSYGQPAAPYRGLLGEAVLAPTADDLGLLIEFHAGRSDGCQAL
jgi:hypothetical protein